jgi:hypothetical protein
VAISSHGTTFSFSSDQDFVSGQVTSISIEEAQPEVVDMTDIGDPLGGRRIMATGDVLTPPKVTIEFMRRQGDLSNFPPGFSTETRGYVEGNLVISCPSFAINQQAVLDSASTDMAVGDVIRGKMSFTISRISY